MGTAHLAERGHCTSVPLTDDPTKTRHRRLHERKRIFALEYARQMT